MDTPMTTAAGPLLNCDEDEACTTLDCEMVLDEYADALQGTPEGEVFLAHYCGLDYLEKWHPNK